MTIELLDLTPWVTKLQDECPVFNHRVYKTIPDEDLTIDLMDSPAAFVYLSVDQSSDNGSNLSAVKQKTTSSVVVEIITRREASLADPINGGYVDNNRLYRMEVFEALIGWKAEGAHNRVTHINGSLKNKDKKILKWTDTFSIETHFSKKRKR